MGVSFSPQAFQHRDRERVTPEQASLLVRRCIEEGISEGPNEHLVEQWLYERYGFEVDDVGELTVAQFRRVMQDMDWGE
jgi:hypothetical protein